MLLCMGFCSDWIDSINCELLSVISTLIKAGVKWKQLISVKFQAWVWNTLSPSPSYLCFPHFLHICSLRISLKHWCSWVIHTSQENAWLWLFFLLISVNWSLEKMDVKVFLWVSLMRKINHACIYKNVGNDGKTIS